MRFCFSWKVNFIDNIIDQNAYQKIVTIDKLGEYKLSDSLSDIKTFIATVPYDNNISVEKDIIVPKLNFKGFIWVYNKSEKIISIGAKEYCSHFSRLAFRQNDDEVIKFIDWDNDSSKQRVKVELNTQFFNTSQDVILSLSNEEWVKNSGSFLFTDLKNNIIYPTIEILNKPEGNLQINFGTFSSNRSLYIYFNNTTTSEITGTLKSQTNMSISPTEYYKDTIKNIANKIITSFNSQDEKLSHQWKVSSLCPDDEIEINFNGLNCLQALQELANSSENDLWFEGFTVYIGSLGKKIDVSNDPEFTKQLTTTTNLSNFANSLTVYGGKDDFGNKIKKRVSKNTESRYNYEKVESNSSISQNIIDYTSEKILKELNQNKPNLSIQVTLLKFNQFNINKGDILFIKDKDITSFFRVVSYTIANSNTDLKLEPSTDGKFSPTLLSTNDISYLLKRFKDQELQ